MAALISTYNIGIIGAGHLGRALAKSFLAAGMPSSNISISFSGNSQTLLQLQQQGLAGMVTNNQELGQKSDIVFMVVRPKAIASLAGIVFAKQTMVVSCMAGCPVALLQATLNHKVWRIMPSSPITIESGKAVCATYPQNNKLNGLLAATGFALYPLHEESLFDVFTACVCLPAAFLRLQVAGKAFNRDEIVRRFSSQFGLFAELFDWAYALTPFDIPLQHKLDYIHRMATPGGITEAIVTSINNGDGFVDAFEKGIVRSKKIESEISMPT